MMFEMPIWLSYLLKGLAIFGMMVFPAIVVGRAGKSPYFALLVMVPVVNVIAVWAFARTAWPKLK